jgi:predicted HAD superfamily phosphohydrolase YqeG
VAVVGDQLFTDVLGGNLAGMYTVLVPPLAQQELGYTRLVRRLERWILGNTNRKRPVGAQEEFDPKDFAPNPRISKD